MVMRSELRGYEVEYKDTGEEVGKIKDIIVDTTKTRWEVLGLVLSPGVSKENLFIKPCEDMEVDTYEEKVLVSCDMEMEEAEEKPATSSHMSLGYMHKKKIFTKDGEKVGKLYDSVITTRLFPWQVWKVLIKPRALYSRRLRIDNRDIDEITEDKITLKLTKLELDEITESES